MTETQDELVAGLRRGDSAAFNRVYALHRPRIFGFLLRLSGRRDVADDLLQDTWMKLARSASSLREDTNLAAWLFTVARNEYLSYRRWAVLDVTRLLAFGLGRSDAVEEMGPEEQTEATRSMRDLERALAQIAPGSREVLLLVGAFGMDQEQVAAILGVSYAALRQRLSRARTELAQKLEKLQEQGGAR